MAFKVKILTHCAICGKKITAKRFRSYCSAKCRNKCNYKKYYQKSLIWAQNKRGEYKPNKVKCIICGKWYVQVGSHVMLTHKITAREYRENYNLPVSRGIVPLWYRQLKGELALENKTYKNLEKGKNKRYKRNDPKAKAKTFYKGRHVEAQKLSQEIYPH